MNKVGLMTWYKYYNYGTALQVVSLNNYIKEIGYDCTLVNYKPKGKTIEKRSKLELLDKIRNKLHRKTNYSNSTRVEIFEKFLDKYLVETQSCNSYIELELLNGVFDAFICGSDQIWSPLCFDSHYYLDYADENKIVSYAPSIGSSEIKNELIKEEISKLAKRFKYLSIREEKGKEILKDISNLDAKVVLDPTFLHDKEYWKKFENSKCIEKLDIKYAICYFLGDSDAYINNIVRYCKKNNITLYNIPVFNESKLNKYNLPFEVGPEEFLTLISNAEIVFTDSFHGTTFSIIYNKPFYVYKRFKDSSKINQNSRIYNILKKSGLEERLIDSKSIINNKDINFDVVNENIKVLIDDSKEYLNDALNNVCKMKTKLHTKELPVELCSGCGACAATCPTNAISIKINDDGFYHHVIDNNKCISCGKCKNICPLINPNFKRVDNANALYSFKTRDLETLNISSSGGFSHTLSNYFLDKGYTIVGCTYNNSSERAEHIIITSKNDLGKIQGSKYIQSETANVFKLLYDDVDIKKLLFIGTPCQVAGAKILLKEKNYEDIIFVDLICHGVPTIHLWDKYINEIRNRYHINNDDCKVIMRKKNNSWRKMFIEISDTKNKYSNDENNDNFYKFFKAFSCMNTSCYECPYRENSCADIRTGDYWGEKFKNDNSGVSMVVAINDKGNDIIEQMKKSNLADINVQNLNEYWSVQYPYNINKPIYYGELIDDLKNDNMPLKRVINKYIFYDEFVLNVRRAKSIFWKK